MCVKEHTNSQEPANQQTGAPVIEEQMSCVCELVVRDGRLRPPIGASELARDHSTGNSPNAAGTASPNNGASTG